VYARNTKKKKSVLWCFVLQTSMDRCRQLVLHPLRNVQPVQLVVQVMAESAVVLPRVADDASGSIQYALELVCGGLGPPPQREWRCSGCVVSQTTAGAETRRVHRAGGDARIRGRSMQCPPLPCSRTVQSGCGPKTSRSVQL